MQWTDAKRFFDQWTCRSGKSVHGWHGGDGKACQIGIASKNGSNDNQIGIESIKPQVSHSTITKLNDIWV